MYMTFDRLVKEFGSFPFFDLSTVLQISGENESNVRTQLHRWMKSGKITALRRGMYSISDMYRKAVLYLAVLANELYKPSYLSLLWALNYYGVFPEKVVTYTSVTSRVPRAFTNQFGVFQYSHVKQSCFFGFSAHIIQGQSIWLADPEKALLDMWHLNAGEWSVERLSSMRFQNFELVDNKKLMGYAEQYKSPRLFRAVQEWETLEELEKEGETTL